LRLAALFSGGKDSTWALDRALADGHDVSVLVTMAPERRDSYMFQTAAVELAAYSAEAMDIPHLVVPTSGVKEEELGPLEETLEGLGVEGIVSGAIRSRYQKDRIDAMCERLGLVSLAPLWQTDMSRVEAMVKGGYHIVIVGAACMGMDERWIGRTMDARTIEDLLRLEATYRINPDGEGGEFETSVLFGPNFRRRVVIIDSEVVWDGASGYLVVRKAELREA